MLAENAEPLREHGEIGNGRSGGDNVNSTQVQKGNSSTSLTALDFVLKIENSYRVPKTEVVFYREDEKACPVLEWLATLPDKARDKCQVRIERLQECGHELRRPEADTLRDGIYELRATHVGIHYRLLYFFHGRIAAVLAHGVIKERAVPPKDIDTAIERKKKFLQDPQRHTYRE